MPDPEKLTAGWVESWENFLAQNQFPRVFLKSRDSIYLACNENYAIDHGLKASEIPGRSDYDLFPRELAEKYRADDLRILESGQSETIEERYVKNSQEFHVQTIKSPFRNPSGEVIGILGMFWDITERKRAEEALRESEEKYRSLVETAIEGVASADLEGNLTFVNDALYRVLGYSRDELLHKPFAGILHPDDAPALMETFLSVVAGTSTIATIEFRAIQKNGQSLWLSTQPTAIVIDGKTIGFNVILRDITDHKRAVETLRGSEERFRALIEQSRDAITLLTADGTVLYDSPSIMGILGYSPTERIGQKVFEFVHTEEREGMARGFAKFAQQIGAIVPSVARFIHKDGTPRWIEGVRSNLLHEPAVRAIVVNYRDITERKRAEEALRESEHRLIEAQRIGKIGSWEWIPAEDKLIWSVEMYDIFGIAPETVLTTEMTIQAFHPDDRAMVAEATRKTLEELKPQLIECRILKPDGSIGYVFGRGEIVLDANGKLVKMIGIYQDITERKRAEEALRESEEKYRALVENANEAIIVTQDGLLKFANPRVSELIGYSLQEMIGRSFIEFIHPDDQLLVAQRYQKRLEGEVPAVVYPFRTIHKDGSIRWAEINSVLITWEGKPAVMSYLSDITERMRVKEALSESEEWHRALVETSGRAGIGIVVLQSIQNRQAAIVFANEEVSAISGYSQEELLRMSLEDFMPPDILEQIMLRYRDRQEGKPVPSYYEAAIVNRDQVRIPIITSVATLTFHGKIATVVFFRDITELKLAEEALRTTQRRLELALVGGGLGIYEHNLQTGETRVDARYLAMLGYVPGELDLANMEQWEQLVHPEDLAQTRSPHTEVEYRMRHKDGRWIWVLDTGRVVEHDSLGLPLRMSGVHQDISERKQAEEALQEERNLFVAGPTVVFRWQPGLPWQVEYASPNVQELLGYPPEAFTSGSLSYADIVHPDDIDRLLQEHTNHDRQGRTHFEQEYRLQRSDGQILWVHDFTRTVITNGSRQDHGYVTDITDRKRAEEALRESEEKHRAVVERANEGIVILQDGIVRFTNPSLLAMTGYETGEVEGMEFSRFFPEENWALVLERYRKRMAGEELSGVFETVLLHKSGKRIPVEMNGGLVQYEGKSADLVIMRDISERKQIEGEMEKTRADFLFGVSHELKTPLFLMNISLEMLENSPEAGRVKRTAEFTETWKRNLHRLQHLVFNMVDSQRTQTMGFKLERQPTDFPALVERVVQENKLLAEPRKIRITADLAPMPPLLIDPEAIHRLVENLLTNAIKFSPRNGEVSLRLAQKEAEAILTVKDRGPGIPTEEQKGLFLPFQRAASTVRSVIPGTGLGLYVAKIIVDAHGGTISMRSKAGQGTTITVRLPLGEPQD